eukprot:TRINITY_DN10425_c0_g1_i1.p1 TRINITY_DN10425_c0_g1~~TRINITY_DN10425_c0_g1_i1.p1  ORF type:complete len:759 (+),score=115.21 TRINITY_DN10425_c0_g1_i1:88-2364(+)
MQSLYAALGHENMIKMAITRNPAWPIHADYIACGLPNAYDTSLVADREVISDCYYSGNSPFGFWNSNTTNKGDRHLQQQLEQLPPRATEAQIVEMCRRVVEQFPECVEAWVMIGSHVPTYEEALEAFQKGEEVGKRLAGPARLQKCLKSNIFGERDLRPLWACMACVANTLRKMGRHEEALHKFYELARFDQDASPTGTSDYINVIPLATDCLFALGRYDECQKFMSMNAPKFSMQSSTNIKLFNTLLIEWKKNKRFGEMSLGYAGGSNVHIFDYLSGVRQLPDTPGSRYIRWQGSLSNATMYANIFLKYWQTMPDAQIPLKPFIRRVKFNDIWKVKHTAEYLKSLREYFVQLKADGVKWRQLALDGGQLTNPPRESHVAHELSVSNHHEILKMLLEVYADDYDLEVLRPGRETPLHPAAFYGSTECVDILLKHGAKIDAVDELGRTPLHNAANQLEHAALKRLLESAPPGLLNKATRVGTVLSSYLGSSVIGCVLKMGKCERCQYGDPPHSANVNPFLTLGVLADFGVTSPTPILSELLRSPALMAIFPYAVRHPHIDPDQVDATGRFPLMEIALYGRQRAKMPKLLLCLKYLLAYRSAELRKDRVFKGTTALSLMQKDNWTEAVRLMSMDPQEIQRELEAAGEPSKVPPPPAISPAQILLDRAMAHKKVAGQHFGTGDYSAAMDAYKEALVLLTDAIRACKDDLPLRMKLDFESSRSTNNSAMCAVHLGNMSEALTLASSAISADPSWASLITTRR